MSAYRSASVNRRLSRDRISKLPANVIENILTRLSLKEAGRTSVLSKSWRSSWTGLSHLTFGGEFRFPEKGGVLSLDQFISSINQVLLLHRAPVVRKFSLFVPRSCPEIDEIVRSMSGHMVEDLTVTVGSGALDGHSLPSQLVSCQPLKRLRLDSCKLEPHQSFTGFSKLITLELHNVPSTAVENLISCCPQLQRLTLSLSFHTSPLFDSVEIYAPNLCDLGIHGCFRAISFKNVPRVVNVKLDNLSVLWRSTTAEEFFHCLPWVEKLEIVDDLPNSIAAARNALLGLPTNSLSSLKHISLMNLKLNKTVDTKRVIWLIGNSPNLKSIRIKGNYFCDNGESLQYLKALCSSDDVILSQLEEVQLAPATFHAYELHEFIRFLLVKSPNLKKFSIEQCRPIIFRVFGRESEVEKLKREQKFLKKIMQFECVSPSVEIRYLGSVI